MTDVAVMATNVTLIFWFGFILHWNNNYYYYFGHACGSEVSWARLSLLHSNDNAESLTARLPGNAIEVLFVLLLLNFFFAFFIELFIDV